MTKMIVKCQECGDVINIDTDRPTDLEYRKAFEIKHIRDHSHLFVEEIVHRI